jgi:hypothetical protein
MQDVSRTGNFLEQDVGLVSGEACQSGFGQLATQPRLPNLFNGGRTVAKKKAAKKAAKKTAKKAAKKSAKKTAKKKKAKKKATKSTPSM